MSSAKDFLASKKRSKATKFLDFANRNLADIKNLLQTNRPQDGEELFQRITAYLENASNGNKTESCTLTLPVMPMGLHSILMNNMSLWIGNTNQYKVLLAAALTQLTRDSQDLGGYSEVGAAPAP